MGVTIGGIAEFVSSIGATAAGTGAAAAVGEGAVAAGTAAAAGGTAAAAAGAGGILGSGISLGTVAAGVSLASTAYALTKGVPKLPTPGTITPTNNATAISQAADADSLDRARSLAGGSTSTMLTGGTGVAAGATTSKSLLGSS